MSGLTLLNPSGAWALLGLALPIAIHLLHRGKRQRVLVGSIRFLKGKETQTFARIKLTEKRLLLLRLFLLSIFVAILCRPHLVQNQHAFSGEGWLLIDPEINVAELAAAEVELLEKAKQAKWAISWLSPGFPNWQATSSPKELPATLDSWSLVAEAAGILPDSLELAVLALGTKQRFRGNRPTIAHPNIDWRLIAPQTETKPFLLYGYRVTKQQLILVTSEASSRGFTTQRHVFKDVSFETQQISDLGLKANFSKPNDGSILVTLSQNSSETLLMNQTLVNTHILVVAEDLEAQSVTILKNAFETVGDYFQWPLHLEVISPSALPSNWPGIAFWLAADSEPPEEWLRQGSYVFKDAGNTPYSQPDAHINLPLTHGTSEPKLFRRVAAMKGVPVWLDSWGDPVLVYQEQDKGRLFHFASKLSSEWSTLAYDPAFPNWLASFVESAWNQQTVQPRAEKRTTPVSAAQVQPKTGGRYSANLRANLQSLEFPLWCLAMVIMLLERLWVFKRKRL